MTAGSKRTAYDVAGHYDAEYYADLSARYRRRSRFARRRIGNVFSLLPPLAGRRLVDLGCGMGTFAIEAARAGADVIGVDPAAPALAAAKRVAADEGVAGVRFVQADGAQLPLADASADVILAADLTEHLDDETLDRVLREAVRVLSRTGRLVLYTPEQGHIFERLRERNLILKPDPSHVAVRSAADLSRAAARAGLRVETLRYMPSHIPGWNLLERALSRWVPLLRRRIGLVAGKA